MTESRIIYILEFPISNWVKDEIIEIEKLCLKFNFTTIGQFYKQYPFPNYIKPSLKHFLLALMKICFQPVSYLSIIKKYRSNVGLRIVFQTISIGVLLQKYSRIKIHCHFASSSTTAALILHELYGYSFGFTSHAWDLFLNTVDIELLKKKISTAYYIRAISEYNKRFIQKLEPDCESKIRVIHCGIQLDDFIKTESGGKIGKPAKVLSASNFVEKKGYIPFFESFQRKHVDQPPFKWKIAGKGPLKNSMQERIHKRGLSKFIQLIPSIPHHLLPDFFRTGDLFFLPCTIASNGDRDGIPVILMEAMASGIITISTPVSGIPELIHHNENGFLLKRNCVNELIEIINYIYTLSITDLDRIRLNARTTVQRDFNISTVAKEHLSRIKHEE